MTIGISSLNSSNNVNQKLEIQL